MAKTRGPAAALALAAVVVIGWMLPTSAAASGLAGRVTASETVASGSWAAVATTATSAPYGTGALNLTFTGSGGPPPAAQYFSLVNTGTLALTGATVSLSVTPGTNTVLEVCTTLWNAGNCLGGTITTLLQTANSISGSFTGSFAVDSEIGRAHV